nr:hypothetical protein BaRGS_007624 [Batillaria attramentaria]
MSSPVSSMKAAVRRSSSRAIVSSPQAEELDLFPSSQQVVVAREVIAQEVSNQSDSNLMIEQKLLAFLRRLDEVENLVRRVENRQQELSARLYSDEFIGFMVILAIMVEVLLRVRPRVGQFRPWGVAHQLNIVNRLKRQGNDATDGATTQTTTATTTTTTTSPNSRPVGEARPEFHENHGNGAVSQNGVSFSPKHGLFLKPELCVVAFRKDHTALTNFIDSTLRHLDDVKLSVRPYYVIESQDHLRQCPRAKLYLVIFEMEERVSSGPRHQDSDLITSTVRYIKSLGATIVLIVTNDEGSKRLTVHALYNTHLRLLQSHEAFQDLTSSGRVFSAWRELTSHQISHMRKIVKTALSLKTSIR